MIENILSTSRKHLGVPPKIESNKLVQNTTLRAEDTLEATQTTDFYRFLRELIEQCRIQIHSTKEKIDQNTQISVKNNDNIDIGTTMGELIKYLNMMDDSNKYDKLLSIFERAFVVVTFEGK